MKMLTGEMVDRYTILLLKRRYLSDATLEAEIKRYTKEVEELSIPTHFINELLRINGLIWGLESDIRKGKEMDVSEIGRRAIQIREFNKERVNTKNMLSKLYGEFEEPKVSHLSA